MEKGTFIDDYDTGVCKCSNLRSKIQNGFPNFIRLNYPISSICLSIPVNYMQYLNMSYFPVACECVCRHKTIPLLKQTLVNNVTRDA